MTRFGVEPRRSLGQHFVCEPATVRQIARLSGVGAEDHVLEIGAGLGSLTLALAETGASVVAVETDTVLVGALREILQGQPAVRVHHGDATSLHLPDLLEAAPRWHLVANLPYNIAIGLVLDMLRRAPNIVSMVVMVQREAAERLVAPPGSKTRGIPSVVAELHATSRLVARVPPSVFIPKPKVTSAVVRIDRRVATSPGAEQAPGDPPVLGPGAGDDASAAAMDSAAVERFENVVRAAFGQRRKMLRRSLGAWVQPAAFAQAGVDPRARPETLTLAQWIALAEVAARPDS